MNKNNKNRKTTDISLIFFILFSAAICVESYKIGLGSFNAPKPGLFPLLIGLLLGTLAMFRLFIDILSKTRTDNLNIVIIPLKRMSFLIISLLLYGLFMDKIGFNIATFVLVVFLLKVIESKSWLTTISIATGMTISIHLIFRIWLGIQLPKGFMGF